MFFSLVEWTGRDLNPRLLHCECSVHARLNYQPSFVKTEAANPNLELLVRLPKQPILLL